jgi:hypothetical protein
MVNSTTQAGSHFLQFYKALFAGSLKNLANNPVYIVG